MTQLSNKKFIIKYYNPNLDNKNSMPRMDLLHNLIKIKHALCQEEQTKRIRGKVKKAQHTLARSIQGRFSNIHR